MKCERRNLIARPHIVLSARRFEESPFDIEELRAHIEELSSHIKESRARIKEFLSRNKRPSLYINDAPSHINLFHR